MILVHARKIEPFVLVNVWLEEFYIAITECPEEAFVAHVTHAVECKFCGAFLEKNRFDLNVVGFGRSAVVVQEARHLQDVESSQMAFAGRIVMVAMDGEDRYGNINVLIFVVDVVESTNDVSTLRRTNVIFSDTTHPANCSLASLNISISHGLSPKQFCLRLRMTWYIDLRDGLFSWKRSPARRTMSTSRSLAKHMISSKAFQLSSPLIWSRSLYPT
jgi:hypothetical protein